jgi:hypothetical protein
LRPQKFNTVLLVVEIQNGIINPCNKTQSWTQTTKVCKTMFQIF